MQNDAARDYTNTDRDMLLRFSLPVGILCVILLMR